MKGILATPRTLSAIRAADALARNLGGGKMRKGTPQIPGGGEYSGPFAVVDSSSDEDGAQITILGYNADAGRLWRNYVTLGITRTEVSEMDLSIGSSAYVYLKITYSNSYTVEISSAASMPAQTATEYYIPLAYVAFADGAITTVTQLQYGQVEGSGRIF